MSCPGLRGFPCSATQEQVDWQRLGQAVTETSRTGTVRTRTAECLSAQGHYCGKARPAAPITGACRWPVLHLGHAAPAGARRLTTMAVYSHATVHAEGAGRERSEALGQQAGKEANKEGGAS